MKSLGPKTKKGISLFLIFVLLNTTFSCYYYTFHTDMAATLEKVDKLKNSPRYIIVRQGEQAFHLSSVTLDQDSKAIQGTLEPLHFDRMKGVKTKPLPGRAFRYKGIKEAHVLDEVHIFTSGLTLGANQSITIPIASITKIDVFDKHAGATTTSFVLGGLVIVSAALVVVLVVALLTKSSCPFVYVKDGERYVFAGEIYSGAIFKSLERDDYLVLPLAQQQDTINMIISNQLKERQFIDVVSLQKVTHPAGTLVFPDKTGKIHLVKETIPATMATVNESQNILDMLKAKDSIQFLFDAKNGKDYYNEISLTFPKPAATTEGHLLLTLKNSLWGDYAFGEFTKLFGKAYPGWIQKQGQKPPSEMGKWSKEQGLTMKVMMDINGKWEYVDDINLVGPLASRDVVVPLDLSRHQGEVVRVKLSAGFMFWDMDYAGIDYSSDKNIQVSVLAPSSAMTQDDRDVLSLLKDTDQTRLEQPNVGDEVNIAFINPVGAAQGMTSTFILHSRGYYEHVRDYTNSPEIARLLTFKESGRFSRFSFETLEETNRLLQRTEISASSKPIE